MKSVRYFVTTVGLAGFCFYTFSPFLFNVIGISFYRFHQFERAEFCYNLSLKANPYFLSPLHNLGLLEKDRGNFKKAGEIYQKVIQERPSWGLAHKSLGACYQLQGRWVEAKKEYLKALILDPALGSAWNNLGVLYFHQGKVERALRCYQKALRLDPNDCITLSNYQRLDLKSGRVQ